ncbi:uncharacterized protein LOC122848285 [Aphidius gifuensis]|uniref:uncharacterized protein LOC122848285 n=1 Tax=Aphidius gifuensis TaxID=684658 RepID=UPI001CDC6DAD|nr:uncharacterized protein LOC122848285 [Aphidius gifuensis]
MLDTEITIDYGWNSESSINSNSNNEQTQKPKKKSNDADNLSKKTTSSKVIQGASTPRSIHQLPIDKPLDEATRLQAAEGAVAYHKIYHHQIHQLRHCTSEITPLTYMNSLISQKISCKHNKSEAIINDILSVHAIDTIITDIKNIPFISLATDSNYYGSKKISPIVIQYFDVKKGGIQVRLLDVASIVDDDDELIASKIDNLLEKYNLKTKTIAFSGDNINTHFAANDCQNDNNIFELLKTNLNPNLVGICCPIHILHNAASCGLDQFGLYDINSLIQQMYIYFSMYNVRNEKLKSLIKSLEILQKKLIHNYKTRWMWLYPVIHRIHSNFTVLKLIFVSKQNTSIVV